MTHSIFTVTVPLEPEKIGALTSYLAELQAGISSKPEPVSHPDLPLHKLPMLHFASVVIFPADGEFGPLLVFENNVDGTIDAYLGRLCAAGAVGLHRIFGACRGYDVHSAADVAGLQAYLRRNVLLPDAGYVGSVGRSVERIRAERQLRTDIETRLDADVAAGALAGAPADAVLARVAAGVRRSPAGAWALAAAPRVTPLRRWLPRLKLAGIALLLLVLWPVTVPALVLFLIALRYHELRDPAVDRPPDPALLAQLATAEDHIGQNHMASLCRVKPGAFRRRTLRAVLFLVNLVAQTSLNGRLSNLATLHFAHWVVVDEGRRLLFLTNYDGSWENYLDDFIDKASLGLTAIWSNAENFPKTAFLVGGGARDEVPFKNIARRSQAFTNLWFSAYPGLSVDAIENAGAVRDGLAQPLTAVAAGAFLQRL